jgi:hypothetical protein
MGHMDAYNIIFVQLITCSIYIYIYIYIHTHTQTDRQRSRDSVVRIAARYGLDDRGVGVRVPVGSRIFYSPRRPDRLWGPHNLLLNGYRGPFPRG